MDDGFYRAFEDRYRGSRELITERLKAYLPFLSPLKSLYQDYPVLDLGCGRGEWLELLVAEGYAPTGVDLDEGMLEACQALDLPARNVDALAALKELPDNSLIAVTGFHIAEHIPFPVLQELVAEALRVLRPAGLLILETPNAESLVVGTNSFYLDPTHERPLPNLLLSFLAEHAGFAKSKIVRLQERAELRDDETKVGVWDVLSGTSPDYAVVGQKQALPEQLEAFNAVFDAAYGVSLDQLAVRYDKALERRLKGIEGGLATAREEFVTRDGLQDLMDRMQAHHVEQIALLQERFSETTEAQHQRFSEEAEALQLRFNAEVMAQQERFNQSILSLQQHCSGLQTGMNNVQQSYSDAMAQTEQVRAELNASLGNAHHWYLRATAYEQQLQAVHSSTSWRVTAPFRALVEAMHWPFQSGKSATGRTLRKVAPHARLWVARRPAIHRPVIAFLDRNPRLTAKLRQLYQQAAHAEAVHNAADPQHGVIDHAPLTERGRHIERALMQAMTKDQN
ncbi:methyltransferase domain-containing protein [Pseudomonas coleopterorum]|uniref:methyltransferase domain-containing protein n=1 Tax=Pseudomonas coleopterorum TaxID=1605838 RepID=UPI00089B5C45|nr:methyltransferase domain-containing protein [Pseudomonas coleopterorum]SEE35317.1 O-antigen chain-terminating methyltransferase [Pseudomonas coleopterorum]